MKKKPKLPKYPGGGIKYGFDPKTRVHNLRPGEKPYDATTLEKMGLVLMNQTGTNIPAQVGDTADTQWYKPVYPDQAQVTPYKSHARQMAENPEYRKNYFAQHPNIPKFNFGGDLGAGLAGVASGALGTIPGVGPLLQQGVGAIHGALDKDITEEERAIMGYGQAAGGITAGLMTGNPMGAISQGAQGLSTGLSNTRFPHGGVMPNAEIEKQELMRYPNGQTHQVDGPSHEQGGVPVNIPTGTQIYSDRLKNPETKQTFAQDAAKYKIIEAKNGGTLTATQKLRNDVRQKKLDSIFKAQEQLKQDKVNNYAKKMGVTLGTQDPRVTGGVDITNPSSIQDSQMYPNGGEIKKAVFPVITNKEVGELTKVLSGGYPGRNDLDKFNALNSADRERVLLSYNRANPNAKFPSFSTDTKTATDSAEYLGGYNKPHFGNNPTKEQYTGAYQYHLNNPKNLNVQGTFEKWSALKVDPFKYPLGGTQPPLNFRATNQMYDLNSPSYNQGMNDFSFDKSNDILPTNSLGTIPSQEDSTGFNLGDYSDEIGLGANIIGQNIGNIADLAMTNFGKKYDKENFSRVNPKYLDPTESLRAADTEASISRNRLKDLTGGNAGAYLSNLAATQTANTLNKAQIRNQFENQNTAIYNQADQTNLSLKNQARAAEQQNKARSEDIARSAARGAGTNTAAAIKDYNMGKMDKRSLDIISKAYPDYEYNTRTRNWEHKVTKEKLKV